MVYSVLLQGRVASLKRTLKEQHGLMKISRLPHQEHIA